MPFFGLLSFLRSRRRQVPSIPESVNALLRASLISTEQISLEQMNQERVNALLRASFFSTSLTTTARAESKQRVNALLRASFISTVPSGPPLFIRLPDLISASNSQNILIIHFFRPFFWLVPFKHKKSLNIHHIILPLIPTPSNILYYTLYTFYPQSQPSLSTYSQKPLNRADIPPTKHVPPAKPLILQFKSPITVPYRSQLTS